MTQRIDADEAGKGAVAFMLLIPLEELFPA
jgi:hypothetical protein